LTAPLTSRALHKSTAIRLGEAKVAAGRIVPQRVCAGAPAGGADGNLGRHDLRIRHDTQIVGETRPAGRTALRRHGERIARKLIRCQATAREIALRRRRARHSPDEGATEKPW